MDEHKALQELKRKNEKALIWFIDRYSAYVNTIIYNIIGSSMPGADIEEISSDVFFTLWMNAEKVSHGKAKLNVLFRNGNWRSFSKKQYWPCSIRSGKYLSAIITIISRYP